MSETTATRNAATIVVAFAGWLACAWLLWRTTVPGDLRVPSLDPHALFPARELARARRHDEVLDWLWLGATAAQLVALALLARARVAVPWGPRLVRCTATAVVAVSGGLLATLPLAAAGHWWQRRYGISNEPYGPWLGDWARASGATLAVAALAGLALAIVAARAGRRWWLPGAVVVVAVGTIAVVVQPLLAPGGTRSLRNGALRAELTRLARAEGVTLPRVVVEPASKRTTLANAEAVGIGPTQRVVLWDTLLDGRYTRAEIRFVGAHELAHFRRRHLLKGLGWLALIAFPGAWVLSRLADPADPRQVPLAVLVVVAIQLAVLPLTNAVSRRYEREADWIALETTHDRAAARALFRRFAILGLADPNPPWWSRVLLDDHPTFLQRIELAGATRRAAASRGGPGSP